MLLNRCNLSAKSSAVSTDLLSSPLRRSEGSERRQTTPICRVGTIRTFDAGSTDSSAVRWTGSFSNNRRNQACARSVGQANAAFIRKHRSAECCFYFDLIPCSTAAQFVAQRHNDFFFAYSLLFSFQSVYTSSPPQDFSHACDHWNKSPRLSIEWAFQYASTLFATAVLGRTRFDVGES